MIRIRRALISVYDKTGVVAFAGALHRMGIEILSTGGTAELLRKEKIPVREVSEVTKFPEMLGGRVKTLHPAIHAGLLALRDNSKHLETIAEHNIKPIDLVAVNLYPFEETVKKCTAENEVIEMIDIGGPAMLRSAAKNFRFVAAVSDPADYKRVVRELEENDRLLKPETMKSLAAKVFETTSRYDHLVHRYLTGRRTSGDGLPDELEFQYQKVQTLRYGENPHQKGALYADKAGGNSGIVKAKQLHGKELSFNNFLDLDAALGMVSSFSEPCCAILKHTNPCGFALGGDLREAFKKAYACDPLSAFGSIIGFNGVVDAKTAEAVLASGFVECVLAYGFRKEALEKFSAKKNLRLLETSAAAAGQGMDLKKVSGGLLVQDHDTKDPAPADLKCVTVLKPTAKETEDLLFAFRVCRHVKSNAIVVASKQATLGLGMGLTSRVDACELALKKAGKRAQKAVLASDGFFPKTDSISLARKYGIRAIIQPGGSIQDEEVIKACNKAKISMVFAGVRHFKH